MCKTKNTDATVAKILKGERPFGSLNFKDSKQFEIAIEVLNTAGTYIRTLDLTKEDHHKFVMKWLQMSEGVIYDFWERVELLNKADFMSDEKHDEAILDLCLKQTLISNGYKKNNCPELNIYYSFSNQIAMNFKYETNAGEEIVYNDTILDLPTSLLIRADLNLKIVDSYKFLKFIDINPQQLNPQVVYSKIIADVTAILRRAVLSVIDANQLCYYDLSKHYESINEKALALFDNLFESRGICVPHLHILRIRIPSGISDILEHKKLNAMQIMEDENVKAKAERLSLQNYELKAEIHKKYPEWEVSLTEREKDNAIERYNAKRRGSSLHSIQQSKKVDIVEREVSMGVVDNDLVNVDAPELTEKPARTPILRIIGIIIAAFGLLSLISGIVAEEVGVMPFLLLIVGIGFIVGDVFIAKSQNANGKAAQLNDYEDYNDFE